MRGSIWNLAPQQAQRASTSGFERGLQFLRPQSRAAVLFG
jgi:hypothetical protein